jgi:hypothetical protein
VPQHLVGLPIQEILRRNAPQNDTSRRRFKAVANALTAWKFMCQRHVAVAHGELADSVGTVRR